MPEPSNTPAPWFLGLLAFALATSSALGCTGQVNGNGDRDAVGGSGQPICSSAVPWGPTALRRLRRVEYRNVVRDLFAIEPPAMNLLPDDGRVGGFTTTAGQVLTPAIVEKYVDAAEAVATAIRPKLAQLFPCADEGAACVERFLVTEGERIFRRPLTGEEKAHYLAVYTTARAADPFEESALLVVESMLVAPQFLFHIEANPEGPSPSRAYALTPFQLASRLSFVLWQTLPDEPLFEHARTGALVEPATFREEALRLMSDARAEASARAFFDDWLMLDAIERVAVDSSVPELTEELVGWFAEETRRYVDHVFWESEDSLSDLFVSNVRLRNRALSAYYGDGASSQESLSLVTGDIDERSFGLLSQAGFLAAITRNPEAGIIYRGRFLRERLLCGKLAPPPPIELPPLPSIEPGMTGRERIAEHTSTPTCSGCHRLMNDLGFALEHFDHVGRYREEDHGEPIDATGDIVDSDVGAVDGALDLSRKLASSRDVRACAERQLFRFVMGREPTASDGCMLEALASAPTRNFRDLFLLLTQQRAFYERVEPLE